ncbi:MAG: hypothetical protein ACR2OU_13105 [Thermomicrobiales bacterium]
MAEVDTAVDRGEAPGRIAYPENARFVMSGDFNVFFACQDLRMQDIPCAVLGRATDAHVRHRRPTTAQ